MNSSPGPIVALFDGNVLDWLGEQPADLATIRQSLENGRLRLVHTHLLRDEPDATPDPEKRAKLAAVREQLVGEYVRPPALFSMSAGSVRRSSSPMKVLAASIEAAVLVTRDVGLTRKARKARHRCHDARRSGGEAQITRD